MEDHSQAASVLSAWVQEYLEHLRARGYAEGTLANDRRRLRHLEVFMRRQDLEPQDLADERVVTDHVSRWARVSEEFFGSSPSQRTCSSVRCVVLRFVRWARHRGFLPKAAPPPRTAWVDAYLEFCRHHRGLSADTQRCYRRHLTELAGFLARRGEERISDIPLGTLDDFLAARSQTLARTSLSLVVHVLRGWLRYLFLMGREREDRSGWLNLPPLFARARLPRHLDQSQLEQALNKVDRSTPVGRRDWAILMILTHYGLRAGEVARIRLDEVDLQGRGLHVRRLKRGPQQVLPLLPRVEEALQDYLERARPDRGHPELFLTVKAPFRPLQGASLSDRVRVYLDGVPGVSARGAHVLRHTLARNLRRDGAPVGVIGAVLGHRNLDSTAAYLRIATDELAEVADNYAELL